MDTDRVVPLGIFVDEGGGIGPLFASVDDLFEYLEWPVHFDGELAQAYDSDGRGLMLVVDSEGRPVVSVSASADRAGLESVLRPIVRERPMRYGLLDADVDLDTLLRALWPHMRWGKGRYPGG